MKYTDLVDLKILLGMLGIKFKEFDNKFKARCPNPEHEDKNPSWVLYKESGVHKCFSNCGFQGPLSHLVKSLTGRSIFEYLKIGNPESYVFSSSLKKRNKPIIIPKGVTITGELYSVFDDTVVMGYLKNRGINRDFINTFGLKYIKTAKINKVIWRDRVCIPIKENGEVLSIAGRDFTELQTPKELYAKNASVNTLFNIDNINFDKPLFVVEGIMDFVNVWTNLSKNVCSVFGVALTKRQIEILMRAKNLIWFPDNDEAGRSVVDLYDRYVNEEFEVMFPPNEGQDPGDCSITDLEAAIKNKVLSVDYFLNRYKVVNKYKIKEW